MGIAISFTVVALFAMGAFGITMYHLFTNRMEAMMSENAVQLLDQTAINLESYLKNMRRISDTMYYSVIKDKDLASEDMVQEMNLLYEANKENLVSIACYTSNGNLVEAVPVAGEKEDVDVTEQEWFREAVGKMENFHFSTPHVQNLFDDANYRYHWVISLSRAVELTKSGDSELGVLLVDMNYSSIEQLLEKANTGINEEYVYLMDGNGEIIYHPKQKLIYAGLYEENNEEIAAWDDGSHKEDFWSENRLVTVKTVSYTGWKIVSVIPNSVFNMGMYETRLFFVMLLIISMLLIIFVNQMVSSSVASPLEKLNESVKEWEAGNMNPDIYIGGFTEVEHLGRTLKSTVEQIRKLMDDVLLEQEEKRKSELDALQSQINPHFLYNTLDSIIWMAESGKNEEVVQMTSALAKLLRQSISNEDEIVTVEREIEYTRNYLAIQKLRYRDQLEYIIDIDEEVLHRKIVKLVIQPLVENSIYHGIKYLDGKGMILILGEIRDEKVVITIRDNGVGMDEETLKHILEKKPEPKEKQRKKTSHVGVYNVQNRLQLYYGKEYGLVYESMPGMGTGVSVIIPAEEGEES